MARGASRRGERHGSGGGRGKGRHHSRGGGSSGRGGRSSAGQGAYTGTGGGGGAEGNARQVGEKWGAVHDQGGARGKRRKSEAVAEMAEGAEQCHDASGEWDSAGVPFSNGAYVLKSAGNSRGGRGRAGKRRGGGVRDFAALEERLQGGHFRYLNEVLYTTTGKESMELFRKDPSLFDAYHRGFRASVKDWPENPVTLFIEYLKGCQRPIVVGDFGCGEAAIAMSFEDDPDVRVHSFDLQAPNEHVTVADIANVPLANGVLDIAIFSLSLMGTNWVDFLVEAHRTLKMNGVLQIAEVKSRITDEKEFQWVLRRLGFKIETMDSDNTMFVLYGARKVGRNIPTKKPKLKLKACEYKRR